MSYPTNPEYTAINFSSRHKNFVTEARNGRKQVRSIGAQQWSFTASYRNLTRSEFMPIYAFIISQKGQLGTFSVTPPIISSTNGTISGNMLVNGSHTTGDTTIAVDGFSGTIKAGDLIKFNNHDKVYMVTADLSSPGALNIEPGLYSNVSNDTTVIYNNVPFLMRLDNDVQEYDLSTVDQYDFEVDLIEAI